MSRERKKSGLGHEFSYTPVKEEEYCYEENQLSLNSTNFQVLPGIVSPPFEAIDQRAHQSSHVNNRADVSQRPPPPKTAFMCFSKSMKGVSLSCALLYVTCTLVSNYVCYLTHFL